MPSNINNKMKDNAYNVADEEKADSEFREKEKCLEKGDQNENGTSRPKEDKSRLANLSLRAKTWSANKTGLAILLLCILLFIFFIIIIALSIQMGRMTTSDARNYCTTPGCLRSAAHVASKLNNSFDPCDNFYEFACGGWLHRHPLPDNRGSLSIVDQVKEKIRFKLRHQVDLISPYADVRSAEAKISRFYMACVKVDEIDSWSDKELKRYINQVKGWSILKNWSPHHWDKNEVLKNLHVQYGATPFFKVSVGPDDTDRLQNIVKIEPAGLTLPGKHFYSLDPDNKYPELLRTFLDSLARLLGADPTQAREFSHLMVEFEKKLAEISPDPEAYRQPQKYYRKMTVQDLSDLSSKMPWLSIIQGLYPSANIQSYSDIAVFDETYFQKLSDVITSSNNVVLHHYLMLRLSIHYAPHLNEAYRNLTNSFYQTLEGVKNVHKPAQDRWEYCLDLTNKYMGLALGAMYVKMYYIPEYNDESRIVESNIISAFTDSVSSIPWVDDSDTSSMIKKKMDNLVTLRGAPDFILRNDALANYYNDFQVQAEFMQNLKDAQSFLRKKEEELLEKQVNSESGWTVNPHDIESVYQYQGNNLVIPAGLLQQPIFDPLSTNAVKYGSLGTLLGSQMFKALDETGVHYNNLGDLEEWLKDRSNKSFIRDTTCVREKLGNETLYGNIKVNGNLTLGQTLADVAAVKFAYKAFKNTVNENEDLPGLDQSGDELFFISYAQTMCQAISQEKVKTLSEHSNTSPNHIRVLRALKQLPEFSAAFQCSSGSPMNPRNKCSVW